LIAYALGSIPFGYLIVRLTKGADIRETGSGGTGATNVSRRAGKAAGVLTLLLDLLKGSAAIMIAKQLRPIAIASALPSIMIGDWLHTIAIEGWWITAAAVAVILGHMFPVWLGFRGGKGVATGVGVFLVLAPAIIGIAGLLFVTVVALTRYVSLGSILTALSLPLLLAIEHFLVHPIDHFDAIETTAVLVAGLIVFAHRANIARLRAGTENKFK